MYKMYDVDVEDLSKEEINKLFLKHDESNLWPVCNKFNVTEEAIRRIEERENEGLIIDEGMEYALALDSEISLIVNKEFI